MGDFDTGRRMGPGQGIGSPVWGEIKSAIGSGERVALVGSPIPSGLILFGRLSSRIVLLSASCWPLS